jgi:DNA-binding transcriptional MerR regulator
LPKALRPVDLARAVGLSTQAVRNYEHWGFLPPAERGLQGYRLYGQHHLHAIRTARSLISGFGWERARRIMQHIHQGELPSAFAVIDEYHAVIHQSRREVEETLGALQAIVTALPAVTAVGGKSKQFHIGEIARYTGVRVSAIRFWEEQGLIHPARDKTNRYRLYDEQHIRLLQVLALLRKTGYGIEAARIVLTQLARGTPEQALAAAENRLREQAEASRRCIEATAVMWTYLQEQAGLRP